MSERLQYFSQDEIYCLEEGLAALLEVMREPGRANKLIAEKISERLYKEFRKESERLFKLNEEGV